jgi:hypothetical protein
MCGLKAFFTRDRAKYEIVDEPERPDSLQTERLRVFHALNRHLPGNVLEEAAFPDLDAYDRSWFFRTDQSRLHEMWAHRDEPAFASSILAAMRRMLSRAICHDEVCAAVVLFRAFGVTVPDRDAR